MRINIVFLVLLWFVLTGYCPDSIQAQSLSVTADEAVAVLRKGPENWSAWCDLVESGDAELLSNQEIKKELVSLLERISFARDKALSDPLSRFPGKSKERWTGDCEDECSECLTSLEKEVASLRDRQALKLLVDLGSSYALDYGTDAYALIFKRYRNTHSQGKSEMIGLMSEMFKRGIGTDEMRKEAKSLVFDAALKGDDTVIRTVAIHRLHYFGRDEALKKLAEISEKDSYSLVNKKSRKVRYPVREAANREIDRISKFGTQNNLNVQASTGAAQQAR